MRKGWLFLIVGGLVVLFIVIFVVLYLVGGSNQAPLERVRDISIVFLMFLTMVAVLLLGALVGVLVWLSLLIKDRVVPLLEQLTGAATRVRGTTEFVSQEVASPIITAYSTVAGVRAVLKTVTGRDHKVKTKKK